MISGNKNKLHFKVIRKVLKEHRNTEETEGETASDSPKHVSSSNASMRMESRLCLNCLRAWSKRYNVHNLAEAGSECKQQNNPPTWCKLNHPPDNQLSTMYERWKVQVTLLSSKVICPTLLITLIGDSCLSV